MGDKRGVSGNMSVVECFRGLYLSKDGIVDQIGLVDMGFQCEPGICLSKIELGVGWAGFSGFGYDFQT